MAPAHEAPAPDDCALPDSERIAGACYCGAEPPCRAGLCPANQRPLVTRPTLSVGAIAPAVSDRFSRQASPSERWVCNACGKFSEPGATLASLGPGCVLSAYLCHAEPDPNDEAWIIIEETVDPTFS